MKRDDVATARASRITDGGKRRREWSAARSVRVRNDGTRGANADRPQETGERSGCQALGSDVEGVAHGANRLCRDEDGRRIRGARARGARDARAAMMMMPMHLRGGRILLQCSECLLCGAQVAGTERRGERLSIALDLLQALRTMA
jgi:hypothetical protein